MNIENLPIGAIRAYEKNPRNNKDAIKAVAESIREFGFRVPIIIDAGGVIIAGHTRLAAAKRLKLETVPVIRADDLSPEQVKAFRIADNKTAEFATWDKELLAQELADLPGLFTGFSDDEVAALLELNRDEVEEDDFIVNPPATAKSKRGDIYELGEHRLMCGDATSEADLQALTQGEQIDLVITDPPYNVDYDSTLKGGRFKQMRNDLMGANTYGAFLRAAFGNILHALKPGGAYYVFHADIEGLTVRQAMVEAGEKPRQVLIWIKNRIVIGWQDYLWQHEPILYGWKEGAAHYFIDSRKESTTPNAEMINYKKAKREELVAILDELIGPQSTTTALQADNPMVADLHPTMKPIKLIARLMQNSSRRGERVLDLFGGSGSTMMAAEQIGRKAYTMELDPRFVDTQINRWETYTGQSARKT